MEWIDQVILGERMKLVPLLTCAWPSIKTWHQAGEMYHLFFYGISIINIKKPF
jgi:hypothetical protein